MRSVLARLLFPFSFSSSTSTTTPPFSSGPAPETVPAEQFSTNTQEADGGAQDVEETISADEHAQVESDKSPNEPSVPATAISIPASRPVTPLAQTTTLPSMQTGGTDTNIDIDIDIHAGEPLECSPHSPRYPAAVAAKMRQVEEQLARSVHPQPVARYGIKALYEQSSKDPGSADLLDAVLRGRPSERQRIDFRRYVEQVWKVRQRVAVDDDADADADRIPGNGLVPQKDRRAEKKSQSKRKRDSLEDRSAVSPGTGWDSDRVEAKRTRVSPPPPLNRLGGPLQHEHRHKSEDEDKNKDGDEKTLNGNGTGGSEDEVVASGVEPLGESSAREAQLWRIHCAMKRTKMKPPTQAAKTRRDMDSASLQNNKRRRQRRKKMFKGANGPVYSKGMKW